MKTIITLLLFFSFLQINAQDAHVYTESGTSFFLQVGPTNNMYSKIVSAGSNASFFSEGQTSIVDRSVSMGIALELVRGNTGFRLQTNRIKIDETFEVSNSISENSFGQFTSENSSITRGEQINYEIVPGVHRYFQINKWLFSGGIEVPFTIYDIYKFSQEVENNFTTTSPEFNFEQQLFDNTTGELPGGYDIGVGVNAAMQYAFNNTIRVGIQYAPSVRHFKIGGETEFKRRIEQIFIEEFDNNPPAITNTTSITEINSTTTQSEIAEFRQKMNFILVFSF